jgi:sugar O-acyltransferase (sialic acid O-acetyltransferase NeuD family)
MKKKLIIIGAGNVGGFISYNISEFDDYEILGFLDDDAAKHDKTLYGHTVLGGIATIDDYTGEQPLHVVIGIASPRAKQKIVESLAGKNLVFPNLISKNVWLSNKVSVGQGVILYPGVSVNYETVIGDFAIMNMNCAIGHNCTISRYSTLAPGVNLAGFTHIGETVEVGIGVSTRQGVQIGANAVIGGQAMVTGNVAGHTKVKGVPAKIYS